MLKLGLLDETQNLLDSGIENNVSAANAIGYRECIAYLKGRVTLDDLIKQINQSTRRLVSKQRKWFRKHLGRQARLMVKENTEIDSNQLEWIRHS
jgi:tRNA dimethylallyltransferase